MTNKNPTVVSLEKKPLDDILNSRHIHTPVLDKKKVTDNSEDKSDNAPRRTKIDSTDEDPKKPGSDPRGGMIDLLYQTAEETNESNKGVLRNPKSSQFSADKTVVPDAVTMGGKAAGDIAKNITKNTGAAMTCASNTMMMSATAAAKEATKLYKATREQLNSGKGQENNDTESLLKSPSNHH